MTLMYADDLVELHYGDCRDVLAWLDADVLVTDPPYGMAYRSRSPRINANGVCSTTAQTIAGDEDHGLRDEVLALWGTERPALVFGRWNITRPASTIDRLIWHKRNLPPGMGATDGYPWAPADEEVYVVNRRPRWDGPRAQGVIATDEARSGSGGLAALTGHPTPKPVDLMRRLIAPTTGVIADPFAGSGATLIAARELGRRAIGVELDLAHAERTARRLAHVPLFFGGSA